MIVVDANLLIYAFDETSPQHGAAHRWLHEQLNGTVRVGLPWLSLLAFIRLVTNPRVFARPTDIGTAWRQVERWLSSPVAWVPAPTDGHASVLGALLTATGATGNLVPDAHLAALAIEHGLILCSSDGDFARFNGIRWENPLAKRPG